MSRAGRGSREPGPRSAWWRVGWERRPSGRHRGPQRREIAHRQPRRSAGTAWSAGLRPASRGSAKPAPMTPGPANVSPAPHHAVGVNGPTRSCGFRPHSPPPFTPAPRSNTVAKRVLPTAARAWSAGLRPASRGSAKPAPMTPGPANVSPAPHHAVGVNGPTRSCGFRPHSPPPFTPAPRSNTVAKRVLPTAARAWSAGLRPASRGSAKPAPMTPGPANVSPAPHHAVGVNGPTRSCGFRPHSPPPFTPAPRSNTVAKRVLPTAARAWSAGLRPASRGSAKPAPMTPGCQRRTRARGRLGTPTSGQFSRWGPSDRHRGPQRRETAHRQPRRSAGTAWSAGLRPASRGSAKPAPMTPAANGARARGRLGTPTSGQFSRWGPAQRRVAPRVDRCSPTGIRPARSGRGSSGTRTDACSGHPAEIDARSGRPKIDACFRAIREIDACSGRPKRKYGFRPHSPPRTAFQHRRKRVPLRPSEAER